MKESDIGLIALSVSLLGTLIVSTWRVSSMAAVLIESVKQLQKNDDEIKLKLKPLDSIPQIETRLAALESIHATVPRLVSAVAVLQARQRSYDAGRASAHTDEGG